MLRDWASDGGCRRDFLCARKLAGRSLADAVAACLSTLASVKRKDIAEAVEQFIASRKHTTEAKDGKRPQLSAGFDQKPRGSQQNNGWSRGPAVASKLSPPSCTESSQWLSPP